MATKAFVYNTNFYNVKASNIIAPILVDLFNPKSVLDVGCGIGTWLKSFFDLGVKDIKGIDGDYVDRQLLLEHINSNEFIPADLSQAFDLKRRYELVISLEVAEHLPETSADSFIGSLCKHSGIIVFSAAIPGQGGQNHINEQWKEYWIQKFNSFGYKPFDLIRPKVWKIIEVPYWYKQNMLVFSKKNLSHLLVPDRDEVLDTVHPELFKQKIILLSR